MSYKSVVISKRGDPSVLRIIENEFHALDKEEVLIKVEACCVGGTDIAMRYWKYPFAPKIPFVPGYEVIGIVAEIGSAVTKVKICERVGALTVYGGYSEFIYLNQDHLVKVPNTVDPSEAAVIILNYTSAYQMLNKVAKVKENCQVLITGASGGVGSALLDLGQKLNLELYGTASANKHELLKQFGAFLIDYKADDFVAILKKKKPGGLDFVFDGVGDGNIKKSFSVLRRGGKLVEYGFSFKSFSYFIKFIFNMVSGIFVGVKAKGYGISLNYKRNKQSVLDDIIFLFALLEKGKIHPLIYKRLPILEAAEANRMLESGQVTGNVVLVG